MARFRNDHGEDRVVPTLGWAMVPAGSEVTVPDDQWHHWQAGGWTPLTADPRPAAEPQPVTAKALPTLPAPVPVPAAVPAVSEVQA